MSTFGHSGPLTQLHFQLILWDWNSGKLKVLTLSWLTFVVIAKKRLCLGFQVKLKVTPLSFWLHLATDETFQMRYIMSPNSKWFQTYRPSKFKAWEKVCLSKESLLRQTFSVMAWMFGTTRSLETLCTSFERSDQRLSGARKGMTPLLPCTTPFWKGHFTLYSHGQNSTYDLPFSKGRGTR